MDLGTSPLLQGWRIQSRTIHALIIRDLMMRYGRDNLGFVWAILEPMILTVGVMFIWSIMGHESQGLKVVEVVFTGYMPLTLWRHLTGSVVNIFRGSVAILYHRRVTLVDIVLSRQALEILGTTTALFVVYVVLVGAGFIDGYRNLGLVLLGWLMMAWIGTAFGMLLACWTERWEVIERFIQPMQYLNVPLSGCFFFVDWLPTWAQTLILYHPLVHCYEAFRAGYFGDTIVAHYSITYFAVFTFFLSFFALRSIQKLRRHIRLN